MFRKTPKERSSSPALTVTSTLLLIFWSHIFTFSLSASYSVFCSLPGQQSRQWPWRYRRREKFWTIPCRSCFTTNAFISGMSFVGWVYVLFCVSVFVLSQTYITTLRVAVNIFFYRKRELCSLASLKNPIKQQMRHLHRQVTKMALKLKKLKVHIYIYIFHCFFFVCVFHLFYLVVVSGESEWL